MEIALFTIYLFLFTWAVIRTRFFVNSGIPRGQLAVLFLLKVMAGIFYGWMGIKDGTSAHLSDTWYYHFNSLKETQLLFQDDHEYFTNILRHANTNDVASFFASSNSYWNNLKLNAFVKLLSVFNGFSFGNYYINVIFYSYLTFFGVVAIYRTMKAHLRTDGNLLIIACFLAPSFVYWCSGLHKDGVVFLAVATIIYNFYFHLLRGKARFKHYMLVLLSILVLFVFRNHILFVMIPALVAWWLAEKRPRKAIIIIAAVYISVSILFFGLRHIHPAFDFPAFVVNKQESFGRITGGNTSVPVQKLKPTPIGFLEAMPRAASLAVLRPYLSDVHKPMILPVYVENIILAILLLLFLFVRKKKIRLSPFPLFILFFAITVYLMIGYTVNNLGAVVRYRSFLLPLILPFFVAQIDWRKIFIISNKIKN